MHDSWVRKVTKYISDFARNSVSEYVWVSVPTYSVALFNTIVLAKKMGVYTSDLITCFEEDARDNEYMIGILCMLGLSKAIEMKALERINVVDNPLDSRLVRALFLDVAGKLFKRLYLMNPHIEVETLKKMVNSFDDLKQILVCKFIQVAIQRKAVEKLVSEYALYEEIEIFKYRKEGREDEGYNPSY